MKKIFSLFMVLLFAFGMTACDPAATPVVSNTEGSVNIQSDNQMQNSSHMVNDFTEQDKNAFDNVIFYHNREATGLKNEELLQYAAKDYPSYRLKVVTLKALEVERTDAYGTMKVRCELNLLPGGEGEYLVRTVTFPKEAEIAVGGEYTVLLYHRPESNTPIVQESFDTYTGGYSPEVCQQYSKYSIWPAEDWLKIYTQFTNAQSAN